MSARALIIAAPRSGSGKTLLTLAIVAALRRRGVSVAVAKSGPDYIDPGFHAAASGAPSVNLDSWAMPPALLDSLVATAAQDATLLVIESAMGLFDGAPAAAPGRQGNAADLAARFALPVLLVLDVSGQSQSAAAVARGFATHDPAVRVAGVVLNRVGSDRHRDGVAAAMVAMGMPVLGMSVLGMSVLGMSVLGMPVLGSLPRDAALTLPERHLGLVQADEHAALPAFLDRLAAIAEQHLDLDAILACAQPLRAETQTASALPPPGQRIALAQDAAFSFVYPHVLAGWRAQGAEIVTFSPLADQAPPEACDAAWLPGGYPELHAGVLAAAAGFRAGMARFARTRPVHGECGGHMVLGAGLEDAAGVRHAMLGLLDHATSFARRRLHLGYRQATLIADGPLGPAGTVLRGHEFHYATITDPGTDAAFAFLADAAGRDLPPAGGRRGHVTGSFFHAIALHEDSTDEPIPNHGRAAGCLPEPAAG